MSHNIRTNVGTNVCGFAVRRWLRKLNSLEGEGAWLVEEVFQLTSGGTKGSNFCG